MKVNVCWFDEGLTPTHVLEKLCLIGRNGVLGQSVERLHPAESFDETNHRWLIACRGDFSEAMRLARDLMDFLRENFTLDLNPYRLLDITENDRSYEGRSIESRLMRRIDSLEDIIRAEVQKIKKSRRIAGSKVFQSIRMELERSLGFHPRSW